MYNQPHNSINSMLNVIDEHLEQSIGCAGETVCSEQPQDQRLAMVARLNEVAAMVMAGELSEIVITAAGTDNTVHYLKAGQSDAPVTMYGALTDHALMYRDAMNQDQPGY